MEEITLNRLLSEGMEIRNEISHVVPRGYRNYKVYKLEDSVKYEIWKNKVIRLLSAKFKGDRSVTDFEKSANTFEEERYSLVKFDKMIGVIESCIAIPELINSSPKNTVENPINISVNQSQSQQQSQQQAIAIFIEAIQDELTGKQQKEIKAIMKEESDPVLAKTKIIDKLKNFGLDITSNIIANIITNPSIWGSF